MYYSTFINFIKFQMGRYSCNISHIHQKLAKFSCVQWLLENLVHPTLQCSIYVLVLDMPCNGNYFRLVLLSHFLLVVQFSYLLRCFIAIHEGHIAVHQDQRILVRIVVLNWFLNLLESLLSVVSKLTNFFSVWNA